MGGFTFSAGTAGAQAASSRRAASTSTGPDATAGAGWPTPRRPGVRSALAAIGNRLYAAGGYGPTDETLRTLEVYDLARDRWSRRAPMPTGRNHVAAAVLDGELIVTGGRPGPDHGGLDTVEAYDPDRNRWRTLAPLGTARSGHAAAVAAGRLMVFGGEELDPDGTTIDPVEAYDPRSGAWSPLPDMVTPRHGVGGARAPDRACSRSRAGRSPGSPTRARSSTSTCPDPGTAR